jgi:hypothetical protein
MVKKEKVGSTFGREMTAIAGGVTVMMQGKVAGVVGVGGSMDGAQDGQCGLEAKKVLEGEGPRGDCGVEGGSDRALSCTLPSSDSILLLKRKSVSCGRAS